MDEIEGMRTSEDDQLLARLEELTMSEGCEKYEMDELANWLVAPMLTNEEADEQLQFRHGCQHEALWAYAKLGRNVFERNRESEVA